MFDGLTCYHRPAIRHTYLTLKLQNFISDPKVQIAAAQAFFFVGIIFYTQRFTICGYSFAAIGMALGATSYLCDKKGFKQIQPSDVPIDPLSRLPEDILFEVFKCLDVTSFRNLKGTSSKIRTKVNKYISTRYPRTSLALSWILNDFRQNKTQLAESFSPLLHELCEMEVSGRAKPLSETRLDEIMDELTVKKQLCVLNAMPSYYDLVMDYRNILTKNKSIFTPLQYWAHVGNLGFVKKLVEKGAKDFHKNTSRHSRSALYRAAEFGQIEVVDYLLKMGASASIYFENSEFCSFIPDFIYHSVEVKKVSENGYDKIIACLEKILDYMYLYAPQELEFQLKIPIDENVNVIKWTNPLNGDLHLQKLYSILKKYGVGEEDVIDGSGADSVLLI